MFRFPQFRKLLAAHFILIFAVALSLTVSTLYLSTGAQTSSGEPVLPLDDAYIHLQYAWQAAHGQFLQYNPGEMPTTGATSLLYMILLALVFWAGISKETMPTIVLALGVSLFILSSVLITQLARHLAKRIGINEKFFALISAGLFAGSGWMAWGFLSGMETGLLIALVIALLWAYITRRTKLALLLGGLAALTRPEAAFMPLAVVFAEMALRDETSLPWRQIALWMLPTFGCMLASPMVNYFFTGSASATGMLAKSLFTMIPFQWSSIWAGFSSALVEILARLLGGLSSDGRWHTFPLIQLLTVVGIVILWKNSFGRKLAFVCAAWVLVGAASTATLQTAIWHHYRYQMPLYPALLLLGGLGYSGLINKWARPKMFGAMALLVPIALWGIYSVNDFYQAYAGDSKNIASMQIVLAQWLRRNTPLDARIAVHDVGAIRYFSERNTIDVVGLTTANLAQVYRNGPGSIYEALEHSQPTYYAVYPNLAPPYFGLSSASALLGPELFRIHLDNYSPYTSATDTQIITRPDWSKSNLANTPQQPGIQTLISGLTLVDSVDIADLASEQRHTYAWVNIGEPTGFPTDARVFTYRQEPGISLADGGRLLTGSDSFTLNVIPQEPLILIARLHQSANMTLRVSINGDEIGDWKLPAIPGEWLESAFMIEARYLLQPTARISLTIKEAAGDSRYSPFYYWAYQGPVIAQPRITPSNLAQATFGAIARLVGFDISTTSSAPGDDLGVTFYWQSLYPDQDNYKVFVHLIDPAKDSSDGIVAQIDEAPQAGTYPFWVWSVGETVSESVRLQIPLQTQPGKYQLVVGVYNSDTNERLPLKGGVDFGAERLVLAEIAIR